MAVCMFKIHTVCLYLKRYRDKNSRSPIAMDSLYQSMNYSFNRLIDLSIKMICHNLSRLSDVSTGAKVQ